MTRESCLNRAAFCVEYKYMKRRVPFLILMLLNSSLAWASLTVSQNWNEVKQPLSSCSGTVEIACSTAQRAFCTTAGANSLENCSITAVGQPPAALNNVQEVNNYFNPLIDKCEQEYRKAYEACKRPAGSLSRSEDASGLQQSCRQMDDLNSVATQINGSAAGLCDGLKARSYYYCKAAAEMNVNVATCADCAAVVQSKKQALGNKATLADGMSSLALVEQANANQQAGTISRLCCQLTGVGCSPSNPGGGGSGVGSSSPQSAGSGSATKGGSTGNTALNQQTMMALAQMAATAAMAAQNQSSGSGQDSSASTASCSSNPNLAGCATTTSGSDSWNAKTASVAGGSDSGGSGGFNLADEKSMTPSSTDSAKSREASSSPSVSSVPNGGGGMPGGSGGGGSAGLGGGGNPGGGAAAAGGSAADILHGLSSGGGGMSAMNASMNLKNGEGGGGYSYGNGRNGAGEGNLDLSQFLPGGKQDPNRKLAGFAAGGPSNIQIQSKEVNIWSRISERIKARCNQGLLRDCIP